jgi:hypothetical protein
MQRRTEVDTPQSASQWGDRELAGQGVSRVGLSSRNRDLRAFDQQKSLDNQVRFQRLDEAVVETYADAVNRGDRFPAILVRREERSMSDWTANHLFAAYARNQRSGIPSYDVFVSGMQATVLAFRANVRYGVPNTEDERLSHAFDLMDSDISLAQATAVCMVSERALRTRWNKRQADRRADEVGLLRNEWDSLLPEVPTDRPSAPAGDRDRLQVWPGSGGQPALLDAPLDTHKKSPPVDLAGGHDLFPRAGRHGGLVDEVPGGGAFPG